MFCRCRGLCNNNDDDDARCTKVLNSGALSATPAKGRLRVTSHELYHVMDSSPKAGTAFKKNLNVDYERSTSVGARQTVTNR